MNLKKSISYKLLFYVLAIYFLVTLVVTAVHLYIDYKNQKMIIQDELTTLSVSSKKSFENAIWDLNNKQLEAEAVGIMQFPIISAIEVYDNNEKILISKYLMGKNEYKNSSFKVSQILKRELFDKSITVGKITLYSNKDLLYDRMKLNFSFILFDTLFTSILLVILFIVAFKRFLAHPLESLTTQIDSINVDQNIYTRLNYEHSKDDELAILKNSVNKMLDKIDEQVNILNENETILHQKIEEKTKQLQDYVDVSTDFVWETDSQGIYTEVSSKVIDILGYTPEELIGKSPFDFMSKEEAQRVSKIFQEIVINKDPIKDMKNEAIHKNGSRVFMVTNGVPILNAGKYIGYRGTDKDITHDKQKDLIILEQSKMVAMGEMIGNIAHQWRQPLSIISTGATGLKLQKEHNLLTDNSFFEVCDLINENAQYLSKTIDDFRNFIKGNRKKVEFKVIDEIESFLHLVEGSIKSYDINVVKDINKDIIINSYPNELIQCFINIFNNAKDALKNQEDKRLLYISTSLKEDKITISFKDNAGGIPPNILPHIFEPYFTTKHQAQGTGLGLSMTYNLISKGMNGTIQADNIVYKDKNKEYTGAIFTITLPLK